MALLIIQHRHTRGSRFLAKLQQRHPKLHQRVIKYYFPKGEWWVCQFPILDYPKHTCFARYFHLNNLILIQAPFAPTGINAMLDGQKDAKKRRKECLITTGATAPFTELVQSALSEECLAKFKSCGFTHITMQIGDSLEYFTDKIKPFINPNGIEINAFAFNPLGLNKEMKALKAKSNCGPLGEDYDEGLLICHSGAGTILDGMRLGLPLIVVPNTSLLDNHQVELAEELARQGYVLHSDINGLSDAIGRACRKAEESHKGRDWGVYSVDQVMSRVVGYEEDTRAHLD